MSETTIAAPDWCGYPEPNIPAAGCWSLLGGKIRTRLDCAACECMIQPLVTGILEDRSRIKTPPSCPRRRFQS